MQDDIRDDKAAAGEIHTALLRIPSVFERLIHIASLANYDLHDTRGGDYAEGRVWQMLRIEHQAVFERWLCLKLREKIADLELCAVGQGRSTINIIRYWIQPRCHRNLIPPAAVWPQQELFGLEFEILLPIVFANWEGTRNRGPG